MSAIPVAAAPQIEKYEILEEIGHGGMATVYRAKDVRLGREVAIKVIHKHLRENKEVATRFVSEARAAASLKHPAIVEVFDVSSEDSKERYIVAELIRGRTLRDILREHEAIPVEIGAAVALEICEALEHAHEAGIIHRDIKPENVLVELPSDRAAVSKRDGQKARGSRRDPDASGENERISEDSDGTRDSGEPKASSRKRDQGVVIKITDFGIAKLLDAQGVTSTGQVLGSPAHMAPEQIEGGEVSARTDVFAVGVLLYECMVGHLPFEGKNPAQVLRRVLDGQYRPAELERSTVGGTWSRILDGALARDAEDRTESPGLLAESIRAELEALGITDTKRELCAYFEDPEGYVEGLVERMVPRLLERGERARKKRDIPGAASDFNRALALRPNDANILRRVTNLTARANRRALLRRVGAIASASALLGLGAFGATRFFAEDETVTAEPEPPAPLAPVAVDAPKPRVRAHGEVEHAPTATPTGEPEASARPKAAIRPPSYQTGPRAVSFIVYPASATMFLNGAETSHKGSVRLEPGEYAVQVKPLGPNECCEPLSTSVTVKPAPEGTPDEPQVITLSLRPRPARARLTGAPSGGQAHCGRFGVFTKDSRTVDVTKVSEMLTCTFTAPGTEPVTEGRSLQAGVDNSISWPSH